LVTGERATIKRSDNDPWTLSSLRAGDHSAFRNLVIDLNPLLLRIAKMYLPGALAQEVVQETWLAVVRSIDKFEERSSLKTWILRIMMNKTRTLAQRESKIIPFAAMGFDGERAGPAVGYDRFEQTGEYAGHWAEPPLAWNLPAEKAEQAELRGVIDAAIADLPVSQRQVVEMRDVHGWDPEDICNALCISAVNQRVLLHRGRSTVRVSIERYLFDE
jgi:RNA polymerase sigma-70 factor, ECF subfamily